MGTWRTDPAYAKACAAAAEAAAPYAASRWARLTPATVARFLAALRTHPTPARRPRRRPPVSPHRPSISGADATAAFASAMDEARRTAADDE
ncbi:hypothetical protein OG788_02195 [Streptomyces sp. NBC_00647]|uniref:hypothetical protein n=1 Tax=Streptomyces sp. NBC_00647 TaxID=2975796 RepID=UPI003244090A